MIRNPEFMMQSVADTLVVVPVGTAAKAFPGMITLNATGGYLWELLENPQTQESLTEALLERYEVTREQAASDVAAFVERLLPTTAILE